MLPQVIWSNVFLIWFAGTVQSITPPRTGSSQTPAPSGETFLLFKLLYAKFMLIAPSIISES